MEKIALLPGGFKPPHAGHYNMAKWLAANTDADSILIKIGSKERDGITRDISLKLWDLYRKADEDSNKLVIVPSEQNSPVRDVYDFIEQEAPEGSTVYLGMGEKDIEDQRFKNIGKFAEPKNIEFKTVLVPPQAGGVSGTEMRGFIKDNDKENFQKYLPDHLSPKQKDEAWSIVSSIKEDYYSPDEHYRDFAKSSEYKAGLPDGHKEDIPSNKHLRMRRHSKPLTYENKLNEQNVGCSGGPGQGILSPWPPDISNIGGTDYVTSGDLNSNPVIESNGFELLNLLQGCSETAHINGGNYPYYWSSIDYLTQLIENNPEAANVSLKCIFFSDLTSCGGNQCCGPNGGRLFSLVTDGLNSTLANTTPQELLNTIQSCETMQAFGNSWDNWAHNYTPELWEQYEIYQQVGATEYYTANPTWGQVGDLNPAKACLIDNFDVTPNNLYGSNYYVYSHNSFDGCQTCNPCEEYSTPFYNYIAGPPYSGTYYNQGPCSGLSVEGCTDVNAPNYNPEAFIDDGSCIDPCDSFYNFSWPATLPDGNIFDNEEIFCTRCLYEYVATQELHNQGLLPSCDCCETGMSTTPPTEPESDSEPTFPEKPLDKKPKPIDKPIKKEPIKKQPLKEQQGKILRVYDFDDTLAVTKGANIKIKHADGSMDTLDPAEFAVYDAQEGDKFDFTEFDRVIKDAEPIQNIVSMLRKDLETTAKVTILTARLIAYPVRRYLKTLDLDVYVVAVGSSDPNDKAKWIENHIEKGYTDILFIDDSEKNRNAVSNLKDKYPDIKLDVKDPDNIKEMKGTMNNQEKAKHAKNLKKLKKYTSKQGDQYAPVPDFIKGTLTRKLYEVQAGTGEIYVYESSALINDTPISLETMYTPEEQMKGMMGRDSLEGGMLFPYDNVQKRDFHMEGCKIPLDIVFILKGKINNIHHNCQPCKSNCPKYSGMADNVLELPGGFCEENNINMGDDINLNINPHNPKPVLENKLNEQYIPEDAGCITFCDPVDFEDSTGILGEEEILIVPICLPGYKPEDSESIESYQFEFSYSNDILQWNQEYSQYVSQMPQLFGLSDAISGGMGMQNEIEPGLIAYAFATAEPFDWSETDVLTYLVFVVTGNGTANFTWQDMTYGGSSFVSGVTDCFEDGSTSVGVEEDVCGDFENSIPVNVDDFCTKCETNSWINSEYEQYCECCPEQDDEEEENNDIVPFKDPGKSPLKGKPKKEPIKKEPGTLTKEWWSKLIKKHILTEGGAAGHMAHPFNLDSVKTGKDLKTIFEKAANSLQNNPGSVKIDGVNSSIRLIDIDGEKQFVMDRGSKKELDVKGITKDDLLSRFGDGHGMVKIGGEVLDMFNEALPSLQSDLEKLGAWDNPNILFNMEYVSGKTNVQDYGSNFIAIHGLNQIENKEVEGKRGPLTKRISSEVSYDKSALQSLLDNLAPTAKKQGFEVYGSVPTEMTKKPDFSSALSKTYEVVSNEGKESKSLDQWLNEVIAIPEEDFIFMNVEGSQKKVGAVSKQVYLAILQGENIDDLFENEDDQKKAIDGFTTYLATEKLGDEVLKVLDSPMGSVENHEGVVIRDEAIASVPFKITGKFILGGLVSDF